MQNWQDLGYVWTIDFNSKILKIDLYKFNNFQDVAPDPSDGPTERRVSRAPPFEKHWHRMILYLRYCYISMFVLMNILNADKKKESL